MKKFVKNTLLLLFILLFFGRLSASPLDSLKIIIQAKTVDSSLIFRGIKISEKVIFYEPDTIYFYLDKLKKISEKLHYQRGKLEYYKLKSVYFYIKKNKDSAIYYSKILIHKAKNIKKYKQLAAQAYNNLGIFFRTYDLYDSALYYYEVGIHFARNNNLYIYLPAFYTNAANIYRNKGVISKALDYHFKALEVIDSLSMDKRPSIKKLKAQIYQNIAVIYSNQKKFNDSKLYYLKALDIYKELGDQKGIADIYLNIGVLYSDRSDKDIKFLDTAIIYYKKALNLYQFDRDKALAFFNIGDSYNALNMPDSAFDYLKKALELYNKIGSIRGKIQVMSALGQYYFSKGNYTQSLNILLEAYQDAKKVNDLQILRNITDWLSRIYAAIGNYKQAYNFHLLFKEFNDSLFNKSNERKMAQLELSYKYEKEKREQVLRFEEQMKRQKIITNFTILGIILLFVIILLIWRSLRIKKKANQTLRIKNAEIMQQKEEIQAQRDEIEQQKQMIEKQAKELAIQRDIALKQKKNIEDSIHYALRIQEAVMPDLNFLKSYLNDYFIYFRPRDIVSGDFYWAIEKGSYLVITIADCTGHGVPGAFMSLLGIAFLNEILASVSIPKSNEILEMLKQKVIYSLKQIDSVMKTRDGMDMALVVIDTNKHTLEYSGAYNPLYFIRKRTVPLTYEAQNDVAIMTNRDYTLYEFKADKMPIGLGFGDTKKFSSVKIYLEKGDRFYMFSDGFPSLFDFKMNRKFTTKRFKQLIIDISSLSMSEQQKRLEYVFNQWVGGIKPIDDVLVGGFEV